MVRSPAWRSYPIQVTALTLAYWITALLGHRLAPAYAYVTSIWAPAGLGLAALLLGGFRLWPGVFFGPLLFTRTLGVPWESSLIGAVGDMLSSVLGALALKRLCHFDDRISSLRDAAALIVFGAVLPTVAAGALGTLSVQVSGLVSRDLLPDVFKTWWLADMAGALILTPLLLSFADPGTRTSWTLARRVEAGVLFVSLAISGWLVFRLGYDVLLGRMLPLYLILPFVIWSSLRLDLRSTAAVSCIAAVSAIWGSYAHLSAAENVRGIQILNLQILMSSISAIGLLLSAAIFERNQLLVQERKARLEAEMSVRVRDDFLAIASHELKTPLTPLKIHLGLLRRRLRGLSAEGLPAALNSLETSERQLASLERLVSDLLDVSRITSGQMELQLETLDLSELVRGIAEEFRSEFERAKCEPRLELQPQVLGEWDRAKLTQVLANLITNALKFGAGKSVEITVSADERIARLEVRDHGIGIAEEDRGRIFERFERAASARNYGGLGLGLYITREIVSALGGTIRVESEQGAGAAFLVELPKTDRAAIGILKSD